MLKLEEEGEPTAESGDPDWRNQASLESYICSWMGNRLGTAINGPSTSRIRDYASQWLQEFRHQKQYGGH